MLCNQSWSKHLRSISNLTLILTKSMIYLHFRSSERKSFLFSTGKTLCLNVWTTDVFMYISICLKFVSINPLSQTCSTRKNHIYCIRHTNLSMYRIIYLASCISNQIFIGWLPHMPFCFFCCSMTELHYLPRIFPTAPAVKMSLSCWDVPSPHIKPSRENCSKPWGPRIHISDA